MNGVKYKEREERFIHAVQWRGNNTNEIAAFMGKDPFYLQFPDNHLLINSNRCSIGTYIHRDPKYKQSYILTRDEPFEAKYRKCT